MKVTPVKILLDSEACNFCLRCVEICPEDLFDVKGYFVQVRGEGLCYLACFTCEAVCEGYAITIIPADVELEKLW